MKTIKTTLIASALAVLGGCVAVPVDPYYPGPRAYYAPAPVYYGPPAVYGPPVSVGIRFRSGGGRRGGFHHR
jgi:hypothetical protein